MFHICIYLHLTFCSGFSSLARPIYITYYTTRILASTLKMLVQTVNVLYLILLFSQFV